MERPAEVEAPAQEVRDGRSGAAVLVCLCCGRLGSRIDPFASG